MFTCTQTGIDGAHVRTHTHTHTHTLTHTQAEKKVEGIRNGCHVTTKKLAGTIMGSGSTMDKHQVSHTHPQFYSVPLHKHTHQLMLSLAQREYSN